MAKGTNYHGKSKISGRKNFKTDNRDLGLRTQNLEGCDSVRTIGYVFYSGPLTLF